MDEDNILFFDSLFLQNTPLNSNTVLEYFSTSPFYDRTCNNEVLKMQSQFANIDIKSQLRKLEGIFYSVEEESQNTLFIINKHENTGGNVSLIKMYYVMHGYIYACPTIDSLSDAKLIETLWQMNNAMDLYEEKKEFDFLTGPVFSKEEIDKQEGEVDKSLLLETIKDFLAN
ncbi:hypothetical protein NUSPORA_02050 [Nucleospora cyclopteri]